MSDNLENIENMAARSPSNDSMSHSQTSITSPTTETTNGLKGSTNGGESKKTSLISPDPTSYVTKARVTRPIPPPPSYNPMQFVQIKPCNLYQTAQEQLKKAEEVKKIKEIKKEEPEDWQNNLDNWKSSRRKRVEHIIDRVVEVKKLELEEHDRSRRKSKTFSEMIEERGERAGGRTRTKLTSLAVYNEDESNDLSDLGIGTSSASGKSSLSEDYDNNSVTSENAELDKAIQNDNNLHKSSVQTREYMASPGYETSSSTAPASSPDPCEYTYESAIQDYKQRISRATSGNYRIGTNNGSNNNIHNNNDSDKNTNMNGNSNDCHGSSKVPPNTLNLANKESVTDVYSPRRGNKIEDRLLSFEVTSPSDNQDGVEKVKVDVPKIDISKRKEIFESQRANSEDKSQQNATIEGAPAAPPKVTLRERFKFESNPSTDAPSLAKKEIKRLSGDVSSIRERLQSLEQQKEPSPLLSSSSSTGVITTRSVDIPPVPPLKDRLSSLQNAVKKEEFKKPPVALVDARQLEIMKKEEEEAKQRMQLSNSVVEEPKKESAILDSIITETTIVANDTDLDDSGIQTTDDVIENIEHPSVQQLQEEQLNAAIAALAMEEKQLEEAANAVNQIEAEFDELSSGTTTTNNAASNATNQSQQLPYEMDFSVSATNNLLGEGSSSGCSNDDRTGDGVGGCSDSRSSRESSYTNSNRSSISQETVIAAPSCPKLIRKPSNEMIHHRNLLKMFKDTFKNDVELVECVEDPAFSTPRVEQSKLEKSSNTEEIADVSIIDTPTLATAAVAQVFANSNVNPTNPQSPQVPSMIPIARTNNVCPNKPPQSPKSIVRSNPPLRYPIDSPVGSPIIQRKPNSAFSINGRVEIFNSKTMLDENMKPYLPHLPSEKCNTNPAAVSSSAVDQPKKHIEFRHDEAIQALAPIQALSNAANHASKPTTVSTLINEPQMASKITAQQHQYQHKQQQQQQQQQYQQPRSDIPQTEIIVCAPPVTILNPDELPKPNTVKALSSCFSQDVCSGGGGSGKVTPSMPIPKPLPRTRIPQITPPQSPTPAKRNFAVNADLGKRSIPLPASPSQENKKKLSIISTTSSSTVSSDNSLPKYPFETTAIVHNPPRSVTSKSSSSSSSSSSPSSSQQKSKNDDPLKPNSILNPKIASPSEMPALVACAPNESSLFKLASAPPSPISSPVRDKPSEEDAAICSNFLSHIVPRTSQSLKKEEPQRQATVEEIPCEKLDVRKMPLHDQVPRTTFQEISKDEIQRCDGQSSEPTLKASSKPTSPILAARVAHSKALIETCEKIIAEERAASNHIKSSLSSLPSTSSPKSTPILARKSKIPKPIQCCIGSATDTIPRSTYNGAKKSESPENVDDDDNMLVGRLHVVETQIKVTTTTPPASPKCDNKSNKPANESHNTKGVKNTIFDFIKKNFGHHEEAPPPTLKNQNHLNQESLDSVDTVKLDEVRTIQNSKFYLPTDDIPPPPLPKTPAPVNIEITRKITTDEILDESNSEQAFNQEINDLLDAELNKLSLESNS